MAYIFKHYSKTTPTGTGIVFTTYKLPGYSITYSLTNLTSDATNPATIGIGETASIRITAPTGYNLPSKITVTGCEYTWEANTGVLNISNPTGNVTIAAEGVAETYSVTVRLTGVTGESTNPTTVSYGGSATFKFTANENYELPTDVEQTGATSYNWNKATGTLVLTNITGPVTITVTGVSITPQLATPTNLTVDGTTVSWDEVINATSYDVYVDGGLYENTTGGAVSSGYTVQYKLEGMVSGATMPMFIYNGKKYGRYAYAFDGDDKTYQDDVEITLPDPDVMQGTLHIPSVPVTITWGYPDYLGYANKTGDVAITEGTSRQLNGTITINGNGSFEIRGVD